MIQLGTLKRFNKAFKLLSEIDKLRCKVDEVFFGRFSIDIEEDSQGKIIGAKYIDISKLQAEPKEEK